MNTMASRMSRIISDFTIVRNSYAGTLLENFFVASVVSVLVIRLYLFLAYRYLVAYAPITGKVVVGPIHFSHILWGGILMLVAVVLLLTLIGRSGQNVASVIGGIGFGAFIDSLGKLITLDPDYHYQPALALIYISLIALFIGLRALQRPRPPSDQAALANALQYAQQAVLRDFAPEDRHHASSLLEDSNPAHPMFAPVQDIMKQTEEVGRHSRSYLERLRDHIRRTYAGVIQNWWFAYTLVGLFVVIALSGLYQTVLHVRWSALHISLAAIAVLGIVLLARALYTSTISTRFVKTALILLPATLLSVGIALHLEQRPDSVVQWVQLVAPIITSVLVLQGTLTIWHSRLAAYRLFHLAILVSIFVTQVFAFYDAQIHAVIGLAIRVLILLTLRFMIDQEQTAAMPKSVRMNQTGN